MISDKRLEELRDKIAKDLDCSRYWVTLDAVTRTESARTSKALIDKVAVAEATFFRAIMKAFEDELTIVETDTIDEEPLVFAKTTVREG